MAGAMELFYDALCWLRDDRNTRRARIHDLFRVHLKQPRVVDLNDYGSVAGPDNEARWEIEGFLLAFFCKAYSLALIS